MHLINRNNAIANWMKLIERDPISLTIKTVQLWHFHEACMPFKNILNTSEKLKEYEVKKKPSEMIGLSAAAVLVDVNQ